jgi:hypothetical protein
MADFPIANRNSQIANAADPVIQALHEQVACYQRLAKLAELQHEHVQQSQTEALLDVLTRRQEVLDQIARFEQAISAARKRWGDYLGSLRSDQRAAAERLLAETRRLLEQITASDRNDALILQQRKLNLGKQINQATTAKQVNRNYAAAAYGTKVSRMDVRQ